MYIILNIAHLSLNLKLDALLDIIIIIKLTPSNHKGAKETP